MAEGQVQFSEYNRAEIVGLFRIESPQTGPWQADPDDPLREERTFALELAPERIFKPAEAKGPFHVDDRQARSAIGRPVDNYGPWADIEIEAGTQVVAFCAPHGTALACDTVLEAETQQGQGALADLSVIAGADWSARDLAEGTVAAQLARQGGPLGGVLARWLRDLAAPLSPADRLRALSAVLTAAPGDAIFATELLSDLAETVSLHDDLPQDAVAATARAMLTLLMRDDPALAPVRAVIAQPYLGNVVFRPDGTARVRADAVLPEAESRAAARARIATAPFAPEVAARLEGWLDG